MVKEKKLDKPRYLEKVTESQGTRPLLCVHGLNQQPSALKPLLRDLETFGFVAYLLHLPGHRDATLSVETLAPDDFSNALLESSVYLLEHYGSPPLFVGYSFGGLLGVLHADQIQFYKMILLAPALCLRIYTHLLRPTLPFVEKVWSVSLLDSNMEKKYRYHPNGVPRELYQSFFDLYSQLQKKDKSYLKEIDGIVFSHPNDELVSYSSISSWLRIHTNWSMIALNNSKAAFRAYNHLCFDEQTLGEAVYIKLLGDINRFLDDFKNS